jgi:hypothetical protein
MSRSLTIVTLTKDNKFEFENTRRSIENIVTDKSKVVHMIVDSSFRKRDFCLNEDRNIETNYYWISPSGIFNSMNFATKEIKTEYLLFLNSGDTLYPGLDLKELLDALHNLKPIWLVGRAKLRRSDGTVEDWKIPKPNGIKFRLAINSFPHQATIYDASIFNGKFQFDEYSEIADWKLSLNLCSTSFPSIYDKYICENDVLRASAHVGLINWVREVVSARLEAQSPLMPNKFLEFVLQYLVAFFIKVKKQKTFRL